MPSLLTVRMGGHGSLARPTAAAATASAILAGPNPKPSAGVGTGTGTAYIGGSSTTAIYGPGIGYDALGNMQVGGAASGAANTYVSFRFKAAASSTLVSVRWYCIDYTHPGYGAGTGGTLRQTIEADSGGVPSGTALATKDVVAPVDDFQLYTFSSPATLTAGSYYHLVFTNIDASPTVNFVSVDCLFRYTPSSPMQPRFTDYEWAALRKYSSGSWAVETQYTPILQIVYGDGTIQGVGYMEANVAAGRYGTITGTNSMVRELITVSGGDRTVSGAAVRLIKASGSTDPLTVRLENSGGTLIDSFTIPASSISTGTVGNYGREGVWVSGSFASSRTLTNGSTYRLRLSTGASSTFYMFPMRRGSDYGYVSPQTYFGDGKAQKTTDGSTWSSLGTVATADQHNCQFYFTVG